LTVSGRSFRVFRTLLVSLTVKPPEYAPVGKCIFCGATSYSEKPGIRKHPLGAEHIIAEGIGGNVEIPLASCQKCEEMTGPHTEGKVLGITWKAMRTHLKLKKAGSGPPPKTLPLEGTVHGKRVTLDIPVEDYPILFMMVGFQPPDLNGGGGTPAGAGVSVVLIKHDDRLLYRKYKISDFSTPIWDNHMIVRMLAKIGHALAWAELRDTNFEPLLIELIRNGDLSNYEVCWRRAVCIKTT
jgi:hypothetical protein